MAWNDNLLLKVVNVVTFLFFFGTNLYSSMAPHGYYGGKETYFTPENYVFWTWSIIDLLLLGFVVFQFFDQSHDVIQGIGWRFALVGVLNAIYVHVFVTSHYIVAFIFSLFVASTVSTIYYSLSRHHESRSLADTVFVHLPFSLWHAWAIVTIFISAFSAFTHGTAHHTKPGVTVRVLVVIAEAFLAMTAVGYAFQSRKGDIAGAIVLAWTLFGIYDHQSNGLIHYFALGSFIVAAVAIVKSLYFTFVAKDGAADVADGERAPLIR